MVEAKSKKLKRLVNVQRQLEQIERMKLADTMRKREEVAAALERVIEALGSLDPVHRLFAQSYADRFARLTRDDKRLAEFQRVEENQILREKTKGDRLAERMKEARVEEDQERAETSLMELLDITLVTPASSKLQEP